MKNSKFDMRPLLGGTDMVFSHLIHGFSWYVILPCIVAYEAFFKQLHWSLTHGDRFRF